MDIKRLIGTLIIICSFVILLAGIFVYQPKPTNVSYYVPLGYKGDYLLNYQFEAYKKELKDNYEDAKQNIDKKFNAIMALLGIAVTTWIGLNIYNYIDKLEFKGLKNEVARLRDQYDEKIKELESLIASHSKDIDILTREYKAFRKEMETSKSMVVDKDKREKLDKQIEVIDSKFGDLISSIIVKKK